MGEMADYYRDQQLEAQVAAEQAERGPLVYYAHCMALYGTTQEKRDVETLEKLGWRVLNPNAPEHQAGAQAAREANPGDPKASMWYFKPLVLKCDLLAFRALPGDLAIPAGVALEIEWATKARLPVIELASSVSRRTLTREQTREYIREVGKW
jgi:hypothetical protein